LYDGGNGAINAEVTGRTTQIEVNADGTKTMKAGGTKTVYSWDADKGGNRRHTIFVQLIALKNSLHHLRRVCLFHNPPRQYGLVLFALF
jgi:hypothetical protein